MLIKNLARLFILGIPGFIDETFPMIRKNRSIIHPALPKGGPVEGHEDAGRPIPPPGPGAGRCLYGRWCGPGCGGNSLDNPPPVDGTDECCMHHDLCYAQRGYFACSCDRALAACLAPKISLLGKGGRAALLVSSWFKSSPCIPWK